MKKKIAGAVATAALALALTPALTGVASAEKPIANIHQKGNGSCFVSAVQPLGWGNNGEGPALPSRVQRLYVDLCGGGTPPEVTAGVLR